MNGPERPAHYVAGNLASQKAPRRPCVAAELDLADSGLVPGVDDFSDSVQELENY
jgi:hypothetical protein